MSEEQPAAAGEDEAAEAAEVDAMALEVAGALAGRLVDELTRGGPIDAVTLREKIQEMLGGDEASRVLIAAAYSEGYEDAVREKVGAGGKMPDPRWADVASMGERKALLREQHLCGKCQLATMCKVASNAPETAMVLVQRCGFFTERAGSR
jgi:hypothetical protein